MLARLWYSVCLLASSHILALSLGTATSNVEVISNGARVRQASSPKQPERIGTPRYHAFQPRASERSGTQNTVMQATLGGMGRRAGETYIAFDSGKNAFRVTSNVGEAATFAVPASTTVSTQVRLYTSDGLYYFGATSGPSSTTSSSSFLIRGVKTSDLGSPADHQTQTTIWSYAGIPGALTGSFSALKTSSPLYLSIDPSNYIIGSSTPPDASTRVSLSLVSIDSLGVSITTATAPADDGTAPADTSTDTDLGVIDAALNAGADGDEAALLKLMQCLTGELTPECEALLASLGVPEQ